MTALDSALRVALPADVFGAVMPSRAVDGLMPEFALLPRSAVDVATALRLANEHEAAVIPWGSGTHMALGMLPRRYDIALDLRGLGRVVEYEPADLTVTVEAGLTLGKLQRLLGEKGQWLPLDPPSSESTIGGVLATNASGPTRYRYGTARDLLIGVRFALPNGEVVKSGGRVVKNVAGYDLGKLQIGALGTLGVIVEATFKVAPLPPRTETVSVSAPLPRLLAMVERITDALLAVNGVVLSKQSSEEEWSLIVQFAGGAAAVERSQRDFAGFADGLAVSGADMPATGTAAYDAPVLARASVIPTAVAQVCEAIAAAGASVLAYPAAGIVLGAWPQETPATEAIRGLRNAAVSAGRGALVLERAPLSLKRDIDVWGETRPDFELMRRIRAEIDPNGILNPGRYIGGM